MNPKIVIVCTVKGHNAAEFNKVAQQADDDGTQVLLSQYFEASCGCKFEATVAIQNAKAS